MSAPELRECFAPQARRWRAVKRKDVLYSADQLGQVEWISHGSRPQAKVAGAPVFDIPDLDAEIPVLVKTNERDAVDIVRETFPGAYGIDCTGHAHAGDEEGAA